MKLRLILLCALALLFPRAADPVGEGPWEKLWGTNVRVTNLPSLEACMESAITTSCILGRGVYDQGATTLDIAVDTTLGSKALVCELGTQITGTASPTVKLTGSGSDRAYVQDCEFYSTDNRIALELSGDVGQWMLDNVYAYSQPNTTADRFGVLSAAADSCDKTGFEDDLKNLSGVGLNDVVWLSPGTTGKNIVTGVGSISPSDTLNFDPALDILPTDCGAGGNIGYSVYDDFSAFHASDIGHLTVRGSTFEGGAYIDAGANGRVILSDSFIAPSVSGRLSPCASIYAGYLHLKNLHTTLEYDCTQGMSINVHQSRNAQIAGGWYSGPLRIGGIMENNNVFISGAYFPNGNTTIPALHVYDAARVHGDFSVGGILSHANFNLITADSDGEIDEIDLTVNGDLDIDSWVAGQILGTMPSGDPTRGCVKTGNAEFDIDAGTVTRQTCDGDLNYVTSGEVHGIPGTVSHSSSPSAITAAQMRGTVHNNTGATGAVKMEPASSFEGANFCVYQTDTDDIQIHPKAGDTIYHPLLALYANDCLGSPATVHSFICFYGVDEDTLSVTSYQGTWTDDGDCG